MIRSLDLAALRRDIPAILAQPTATPRAQYENWARAHQVDLGD